MKLADGIAARTMPVFDLQRHDIDLALARTLPEAQARRHLAILLQNQSDSWLLGLVDPNNLRAQDAISQTLRRPVDVVQVEHEALLEALDRIYGKTEQLGERAREVERNIERESGIVDLDRIGSTPDDAEAPVVRLLQTIFDHAAQVHASDVHIEPQEKTLLVRYRIDGALHVQAEADLKIASPLVVRLKLMAGLDIAEKRLPQDGRIAVRSGLHKLDVRMSTLPTLYGESVVLRILMQQQGLVALTDTGMSAQTFREFQHTIEAPHGIVLVTGPTGSGKTTTLYGALQMINRPDVKILTCEDPVEYRMPGIVQVQVNEKIGLDFARVLRSFLRQDPDVIFIGEIRDQETAQIASRAAMTGHMVLSTLHTNDAVSTPGRLVDMGIPPYLIASTLLAVVSQRLVRLICPHCRVAHTPNDDELDWLQMMGVPAGHHASGFFHGAGCTRCHQIGYLGRTGVHELLSITPPLARALRGGVLSDFESCAAAQLGENTIARRVIDLMQQGRTTIAEAIKVISWGDA